MTLGAESTAEGLFYANRKKISKKDIYIIDNISVMC